MSVYGLFSIRDYSDEISTVKFYFEGDVTSANYDLLEVFMVSLQNSLEATIVGNVVSRRIVIETPVNDTRPANPYAQREIGLRLFYKDRVSGKKYHVTIPTANLSLLSQPGSDDVPVSVEDGDPPSVIVAAMEAYISSPDGNGVRVYKGKIVGKNS